MPYIYSWFCDTAQICWIAPQFINYEATVPDLDMTTTQTPTMLRNRRDLTQLSDVTSSLALDGSSPQIMMESFGRRRRAPMFRTGGGALLAAGSMMPAMGMDQSTLISAAAERGFTDRSAIIELEDSDCSLQCPNGADEDRTLANSYRGEGDTINAR